MVKTGNDQSESAKTEQELAQAFIKEYEALCEKHQFQVIVNPTLIARDDGTWSIKLISQVGRLPKQEKVV